MISKAAADALRRIPQGKAEPSEGSAARWGGA